MVNYCMMCLTLLPWGQWKCRIMMGSELLPLGSCKNHLLTCVACSSHGEVLYLLLFCTCGFTSPHVPLPLTQQSPASDSKWTEVKTACEAWSTFGGVLALIKRWSTKHWHITRRRWERRAKRFCYRLNVVTEVWRRQMKTKRFRSLRGKDMETANVFVCVWARESLGSTRGKRTRRYRDLIREQRTGNAEW